MADAQVLLHVVDKPSGFLFRNAVRPIRPEVSLIWLGGKGYLHSARQAWRTGDRIYHPR